MAKSISKKDDIERIIGMQEDIDPAVLAMEGAGGGTGVVLQNTPKHSSATLQRCKTINNYIEKLQGDIRMLSGVQDALGDVKNQLEKEKVDTMIAERISKEALAECQSFMDTDTFAMLLENTFGEKKVELCATLANALVPVPATQIQAHQYKIEVDQALLDTVVNGLDEPDLPPPESNDDTESE